MPLLSTKRAVAEAVASYPNSVGVVRHKRQYRTARGRSTLRCVSTGRSVWWAYQGTVGLSSPGSMTPSSSSCYHRTRPQYACCP
eukprot:3348887-Rhodomonas_salina.1